MSFKKIALEQGKPNPPRRERPIHLLFDPRVSEGYCRAAEQATREVLVYANVAEAVPIGRCGSGDFRRLLDVARRAGGRPNQLEGCGLLGAMRPPFPEPRRNYVVIIVSDDLYDGVVPGEHPFNVGMSKPDFGAVISLYRILDIPEDNRLECFQSVVMHEVGHVFGAVDRETNVVERLGKHCANVCVMRPGSYKVVKHWTMITCDRQQHGAFCPECLVGLRAFFSDSLCGP